MCVSPLCIEGLGAQGAGLKELHLRTLFPPGPDLDGKILDSELPP